VNREYCKTEQADGIVAAERRLLGGCSFSGGDPSSMMKRIMTEVGNNFFAEDV
jgi:hypothetical protein